MKKSAEILGLPVISVTEGSELGRSKTLLIDAHNKAVAAITIEDDDWYRGVKLIPYESVIAIGDDAVIINNSENILKLDDAGDYENLLDENIRIIGTKAITKNGMIQGTVTEITIGDAGKIEQCEITMADGNKFDVPVDQISIFGKQVTVISAEMEKKTKFVNPAPTEQSEPIESAGFAESSEPTEPAEPVVEDVFIPEPTTETVEEVPAVESQQLDDIQSTETQSLDDIQPTTEETQSLDDIQSTAEDTQSLDDIQSTENQSLDDVQSTETQSLDDIQPTETQSLDDIQSTDTQSLDDIQSTETQSLDDVQSTDTQSLDDIQSTETQSLDDVQSTETQSLDDIQSAETQSLDDVQSTETQSLDDVQSTETQSLDDIQSTETQSLDDVQSTAEDTQSLDDVQSAETQSLDDIQSTAEDTQSLDDIQPTAEEISAMLGNGIAALDDDTVSPEVAAAQALLADQNLGGGDDDEELDSIPMPEIPMDIDAQIPKVVEPLPEEFANEQILTEEVPLDQFAEIPAEPSIKQPIISNAKDKHRILIGKTATRTVRADNGTLIVEAGGKITDEVLQRAKMSGKLIALSMSVH